MNEALEQRFRMLKDPGLHQIALWKLEGYTNRRSPRQLAMHAPDRRAEAGADPGLLGQATTDESTDNESFGARIRRAIA